MSRSVPPTDAPEANLERFGALLRHFRLAAGLSQERLAEMARLSSDAVSALERGTRTAPQRQTLALLIEALGLSAPDREALTLAAVRPAQPRLRTPRVDQSTAPSHLPSALTSFVGRTSDIAAILKICESSRLTSILGPGGVGKSRLALEVARESAPRFPDGVTFVPLAPLLPGGPVLPALASALGVRDEGSVELEEMICSAIGRRAMLLVLDNCEHVLDELAPAVHRVLTSCPGVRIMATSRERLRVDGERIYRLRPLTIDDALTVFVDRAAASGFERPKNSDDGHVAKEICARLDCMPLAIELAASCSDMLGFEAILARLRERFILPTTPARSALPQHRSMRALVEWSYDRLEPTDAAVFRGLAPCVGGCRLDDAQAILAGGTLSHDDVVYALFRLHEVSLLDADRAQMPRFHMLQTIRDFATSRLDEEEREAVFRNFARHYLSVVAAADKVLRSVDQAQAIARISAETANVRVALVEFANDEETSTPGLAALGSLSHYGLRTGRLTEAADLFAAVDFSQFRSSPELAAALTGGAFVELNRRMFENAHRYALHGREVARDCNEAWYRVYAAIAEHSIAALSGGAYPASEPFEPYYRLAIELQDPWLIGSAADRMAINVEATDRAASTTYLEYALSCAEASGDSFAIHSIQLALARSMKQSAPREAAALVAAVWGGLEPSQTLRRSHCAQCLADVAMKLQRFDDAAYLAGAALAMLHQIRAPRVARVRLDDLTQQLATDRAAIIRAGDQATTEEANERIASFMLSVASGY
jgi:predicted ATPase/transcriptional regulator with XRE-family HTH domain